MQEKGWRRKGRLGFFVSLPGLLFRLAEGARLVWSTKRLFLPSLDASFLLAASKQKACCSSRDKEREMKKKERENEKKGTRERKGRKKRLFHHFFWVSWHLRHRLQDLFSSELQRMAFFCFLSRCQKSDVQMQRREKNAAFLLQVFSPSFISSPFSAFRAPFPLLRTAAQVLDGRNRATPLFQEDRTRNHHRRH